MISIIKMPTEINSSFISGTSKAPPIIKNEFDSEATNKFSENGVDLEGMDNWVDLEDLNIDDQDKAFQSIKNIIQNELTNDKYCISIGGDHSITYPIISAYGKIFPRINIVHFDAHPDLYENFDDNPFSHASPFARIMENDLARSLTQIGIRTMNDHQQHQAIRYDVNVITMAQFSNDLKLKFVDPVYISIDLDGLDPAYAPGVSHPEPGGLSTREVIDIISNIDGKVIGADIVEYNPDRDINNITAVTAAKLLKELMGKIMK